MLRIMLFGDKKNSLFPKIPWFKIEENFDIDDNKQLIK